MSATRRYIQYLFNGKTYVYDRLTASVFTLSSWKFTSEEMKHW